jgi:hypothetical protein
MPVIEEERVQRRRGNPRWRLLAGIVPLLVLAVTCISPVRWSSGEVHAFVGSYPGELLPTGLAYRYDPPLSNPPMPAMREWSLRIGTWGYAVGFGRHPKASL